MLPRGATLVKLDNFPVPVNAPFDHKSSPPGQPPPHAKPPLGDLVTSLFLLTRANQVFSSFLFLVLYPVRSSCVPHPPFCNSPIGDCLPREVLNKVRMA